jgi:hypothetical protein
VKFDDVAYAAKTMRLGPYGQATGDADAGARFAEAGVRLFVECVAFGR